jgi:hypothetical protein
MQSSEELELVEIQLGGWNAKFMIQLANGGMLDPQDLAIDTSRIDFIRTHPMQWMRTTSVGPYLWGVARVCCVHVCVFEHTLWGYAAGVS